MTGPIDPSSEDPDLISSDADEMVESDGAQHRRYRIQRELQHRRLDRFLCGRLPSLSRSRLQKLINEGAVMVNGREPKASTALRPGDVVDVVVPPPAIKQVPAEDIPLEVLYEDDALLVVNKQADLVVHPARSNLSGTLVNALAWRYRHIAANGLEALSSLGVEEFRPGIVHRLDKDTTGAIIVAKTDEAHWRLNKQFERRTVQKYYLALVHGAMKPPGDVIDQPIGKHPTVAEAYAVRNDGAAREAVTIYRVREVFDGYSLVELELKTGRTHQIRVHLTWLGFPIVTDVVYGGEPVGPDEIAQSVVPAGGKPMMNYARQKAEGLKLWDRIAQREDLYVRRPMLHAAVIDFEHPLEPRRVRITAPLKPDMAGLIRTMRDQAGGAKPLKADGAQVDLSQIMGEGEWRADQDMAFKAT